jgi:hypothetical protein
MSHQTASVLIDSQLKSDLSNLSIIVSNKFDNDFSVSIDQRVFVSQTRFILKK